MYIFTSKRERKNSITGFSVLVIVMTVMFAGIVNNGFSQVNYTRNTLSGQTYTPLSGGGITTINTTAGLTAGVMSVTQDDGAAIVTLPFTWTYNGNTFTTATFCTNGWLGAGSQNTVTAINSRAGANFFNTTEPFNVVAAWFKDMGANFPTGTGSMRHGLIGTDVYAFQWNNAVGSSFSDGSSITISFQVNIYGPASTNPGRIDLIYGPTAGSIATAASIGLKNAVGGTGNYLNALDGSTSSTTTSSAWPGNGNGYRFDPYVTCVAPASQPTALSLTPAFGSISGSFTAAAGTPTGYLVVRYPGGAAVTNPSDASTYTIGQALGLGTVVASSAATSFSTSGLPNSTPYDFYVYAYNNTTCLNGPVYNTTSALTGSATTPTPSLSGTKTVGSGGNYDNLTQAFAAINATGLAGNIEIQLITGYPATPETYPITGPLTPAGNGFTIKVYPTVTGLSITSANPTGTLNLSNTAKLTIDGRINQTGSTKDLTISNTNVGASYAISLSGDATNNAIQFCTLTSRNTGTASGTILFGGGTVSGNDNNTIDNCDILDGASTPVNAIYSAGSSVIIDNSSNTVSNSNIANYFAAGSATAAILLTATGNSSWTISSNRFYQTASRTYTTGATHSAISIGTGSGYTITGNIIGFANSAGTGSTNLLGLTTTGTFGGTFPSAYTIGTATLNATRFIGINCAFTVAGAVSNIQNNTIAGIALLTSSGAATTNGVLCGIALTSGNANIGTATGNTIGSTTGQGSLYAASSTTGATVVGIYASSANTLDIQNNTIGALDGVGITASLSGAVTGIDIGSGASNVTVSNNTVGNSTADNIRVGYILNGANLSNAGTGTGILTSTTGSSSAIVGVRSASTGNIVILNSNTVRGWVTSGTVTTVTGVTSGGSMSGATPSVTVNSNIVGTASLDWIRYAVANSGALLGINVTNTVATTHSIQNNIIRGITHTVGGSGTHTYITISGATAANNIATVNGNQFNNLNVNTTGTITFISHNYVEAATGTLNLNNNSIVTGFARTAAGSVTLTSTNSTSSAGSILNQTGNNFSNITVTGASTLTGFTNTDGTTGTIKTITGNTFNNWNGTTNSIICMTIGYINGASSISNNTITNIAGQGAITGITIGSSQNTGNPLSVSGNTINNLISSGTGGNIIGIGCSNTSPIININGNTINTLSSTAASALVTGINITGAVLTNTFANKIYDLSASGATPLVSGIAVSAGTTNNIYNNIIGDLRAPSGNIVATTDLVRGISLTTSTSSSSVNIYFNTIRLSGAGGANFSASGIFHTASATATTATLNLRNNIIINLCTPSGAGKVSALRRSAAATLGNYGAASNKNLLYAGTPGTSNAIMWDGITIFSAFGPAATAGTYQNTVSTRDALSFTAEAGYDYSAVTGPTQFFQSITGSNANFLHILAGITTQVEGGADPISTPSITTDFDGDTRNATKPDVGADEFVGTSPAPAFSNVTVPAGTCTVSAHTINATIVPTTGTLTSVQLTYNNGASNTIAMTNPSGNLWTAQIPAASPVNTTVTWSINATNSVGISSIFTGTSYADEPLFTVPLTSTKNPNTAVCAGSSVVLTASLPASITIGTQSTTEFTGSPYRNGGGVGDYRHEYLFTAAELSAAGVTAGNLTSLSFNVTSAGSGAANNFTIKIANTSATVLNTTFQAGTFTTVYGPQTYTAVSGINLHSFSTPFTWNGTSNILVDICYTIAVTGGSATVAATTPSAVSNSYLLITSGACTATTAGGTAANRPLITFGVDGFAPYTYAWNDGTSDIATTTSTTVTPASTTTYTFTITSISNSCTKSTVQTVTVNPVPAAPTTTPSTQCGTGIPTASASGTTNGNYRWYTVSSGGTAIAGEVNSVLGTTSISATTTYYVSINNGTCESTRTPVTASVNAADAISASSDGPVCANSPLTLTATVTGTSNGNNYTYTWSANPATGSGIPTTVAGGTGAFGTPANTVVTPASGGTYTYTVNATDNVQGCNTSATVNVTINALPVINAPVATPASICIGGSSSLSATSIGIGTGANTVGTDNATTKISTTAVPYRTGATVGSQYKGQYLVLASELTAAGFSSGNLTALSFFVNTVTTPGAMSNMTFKIAATPATSVTSTFLTPTFTTVLSLASYAPVLGINMHTFSTPFSWDGTSNIVVEVCGTLATGGSGCTMATYTTAANTTIGNSGSATGCTDASGTAISLARPVMRFGGQTNTDVTATYNWVWNPGALSGPTVTVTPSSTTTYTVTATNPVTTCAAASAPVTVTVNPIPAAPVATNSTQCGIHIPTASVSTGGANGTYKWYDAAGGGTLVQNGGSTYSGSVSTTTTFYVSETSAAGCESARTPVTVTVTTPDVVQASISTTACLGSAITLVATVTNNPNSNNYTYTWSANPATGSGIPTTTAGGTGSFGNPASTSVTPAAAGTYTYTVSATDNVQGCITTATVNVTVTALPVGW